MKINELVQFLDQTLEAKLVKDYAPNGLQIAGTAEIKRVVCGVSANQALIERAIAVQAQAIVVHHGYFWKGEDSRIVGIKQRRIATLMQHGINLIAYHLPLDTHPIYGNNALWGDSMGAELISRHEADLLCFGSLQVPLSPQEFGEQVQTALSRQPLHISSGKQRIQKIAWCSGAAQDYIERAAELGADAFLSGEIAERTPHLAYELCIDYLACGHHATEIFGVQALARLIAEELGLSAEFCNIPNPI